jgi:hypothetical protein
MSEGPTHPDLKPLGPLDQFLWLTLTSCVFAVNPFFLVCSVAEGHEGGYAAPAPGLNNLPVHNDQVWTVLS